MIQVFSHSVLRPLFNQKVYNFLLCLTRRERASLPACSPDLGSRRKRAQNHHFSFPSPRNPTLDLAPSHKTGYDGIRGYVIRVCITGVKPFAIRELWLGAVHYGGSVRGWGHGVLFVGSNEVSRKVINCWEYSL